MQRTTAAVVAFLSTCWTHTARAQVPSRSFAEFQVNAAVIDGSPKTNLGSTATHFERRGYDVEASLGLPLASRVAAIIRLSTLLITHSFQPVSPCPYPGCAVRTKHDLGLTLGSGLRWHASGGRVIRDLPIDLRCRLL